MLTDLWFLCVGAHTSITLVSNVSCLLYEFVLVPHHLYVSMITEESRGTKRKLEDAGGEEDD